MDPWEVIIERAVVTELRGLSSKALNGLDIVGLLRLAEGSPFAANAGLLADPRRLARRRSAVRSRHDDRSLLSGVLPLEHVAKEENPG